MRLLLQMLLAASAMATVGCNSPEFHELKGKVVLHDAPDFTFAGDVLELRLDSNPLQRAFGKIEANGTFHLETLDDGKIVSGAKPGVYEARIVLADDEPQHNKFASQSIGRKFTDFKTSGLKVHVPSEDAVLRVGAK